MECYKAYIPEIVCTFEGCKATDLYPMFLGGKEYCKKHYFDLLEGRFRDSYERWDGTDETLGKFLYNFSRYYDETVRIYPGCMSRARIRDRGYNFTKTEFGLTFQIERHYGAWTRSVAEIHIHTYVYNIETNVLELLIDENTGRQVLAI